MSTHMNCATGMIVLSIALFASYAMCANDACCYPDRLTFSLYGETDTMTSQGKFQGRVMAVTRAAVDFSAGRMALNVSVFSGSDFRKNITLTRVFMDYTSGALHILNNGVCKKTLTPLKMHPACMLRSDAVEVVDSSTVGVSPGTVLSTKRYRFTLTGNSGGESLSSFIELRVSSAHCTPYSEVVQERRGGIDGPIVSMDTTQYYNVTLDVNSQDFELPSECEPTHAHGIRHSFGAQDVNQIPLPKTAVHLLRSLAQEEVFSGDNVSIRRPKIVNDNGYVL